MKNAILAISSILVMVVLCLFTERYWGYLGLCSALSTEFLLAFLLGSFGKTSKTFVPMVVACSVLVGATASFCCFESLSLLRLIAIWIIILFFIFVSVSLLATIQFYREMKEMRKEPYPRSFFSE